MAMPVDPRFSIVMGPASLARELWRFGEDDLWRPALALTPATMLDLAPAFGWLARRADVVEQIWPDPPRSAAVLVRAIERLEGAARPAARRRRRPERLMPPELRLTEEELWADLRRVEDVEFQRRSASADPA